MRGHFTEVFDAFYKAVWDAAWQEVAISRSCFCIRIIGSNHDEE
jgi:hypothetical protein